MFIIIISDKYGRIFEHSLNYHLIFGEIRSNYVLTQPIMIFKSKFYLNVVLPLCYVKG